MALLRASNAFLVSPPASLQSRCVSSFTGMRLTNILTSRSLCTKKVPNGQFSVRARRSFAERVHLVEDKVHKVGDHFLDDFSNYIYNQIRKPFAKYLHDDWDPLHFLPVDIQTKFKKTEALATLVVRELLVFTAIYLAYKKVNSLCRLCYRIFSQEQKLKKEFDEAAYEESPFRAARSPIRCLIVIWASTRLIWVTAMVWKMQAVITPLVILKLREASVVCTFTWFLLRWKQQYTDELLKAQPHEEPRIRAVEKITSLFVYALALSCIAEVLDLTLSSFLAVGGVSGLAVGLAAKEVVSNMFGGASLFLQRPFVIGEKIKAGNVSGRVQDIGFMQTKVQGFDGVPVTVPNQAFTSQVITNFSRAQTKVLMATFQLKNRHIFFVHDITEKVQKYLHAHPLVELHQATPICYLQGMERNKPKIAITCYIKATSSAAFYKIQQEMLVHVAEIITETLGPDSPFISLKDPTSKMKVNNTEVEPGLVP